MKSNLLKTIILLECIVLLLTTIVSTILFLCDISVGYTVFLIASYVLYPLILLSLSVGLALKAVEMKAHKLNFILFGANLAVSFVCLLALLSKFASALEGF